MTTSKHARRLRGFHVVAICLIAVVTVLAVTYGLLQTFSATHGSGGALNFVTYAPKSLPMGVSEKARSVDVWSSKTQLLTYHKIFTVQLNDPTSFISEQRAEKTELSCQDEDIAENTICKLQSTPAGQKYKLVTTYDQTSEKRITGQDLYWIKGETAISISLSGDLVQHFDLASWESCIDSFAPVSHSGLLVKRYSPGP